MDDLLLREWSDACALIEAAIASPDPDAYFDLRSRWRRVEETVLAVLGGTEGLALVHDETPYLRALGARVEGVPETLEDVYKRQTPMKYASLSRMRTRWPRGLRERATSSGVSCQASLTVSAPGMVSCVTEFLSLIHI